MRIAYILETYPCLSETFIAREIEALRRLGFEIDIFALEAGPGAEPIEHSTSLPIRALSKISPALQTRRWQETGAQWWRALPEETQKNIEHVHGAFASLPAAIAWGAAEAAGLPWSFSGHARDLFAKGCDLHALASAANFTTACTHAGVEALKAKGGREVLYAPHGLQLEYYPFAPRQVESGEPPRILSVGRLVEKKGYDILLRALAQLKGIGFLFSAEIIGEGPLRPEFEKQIAKLAFADCVQLKGAMPHEAVIEAMQAAHCLVFSGREARDGDRDGLPNVIVEAAALGLPIVAARVGATTDFLDPSTGRLFPAENAEALAGEIKDVFADTGSTLKRMLEARSRVIERFDIARNILPLSEAFAVCQGTKPGL